MKDSLTSCSKQNITKGNTKTIVLPEPVNAMPMISLPERLSKKEITYYDIKVISLVYYIIIVGKGGRCFTVF